MDEELRKKLLRILEPTADSAWSMSENHSRPEYFFEGHLQRKLRNHHRTLSQVLYEIDLYQMGATTRAERDELDFLIPETVKQNYLFNMKIDVKVALDRNTNPSKDKCDGTIPKSWKVIGGGVSFDVVAALRAGIAGEIGTYSIRGEDYVYASKGVAIGTEASVGANMYIIIGPPDLPADAFAGFGVTGSKNWGVTGWSIGWSPSGYIVIKGGLGLGLGGSVTTGRTVVAPAPDLYKGTEFEGSPYGPIP